MSRLKLEEIKKRCMRHKCKNWERNSCTVGDSTVAGPCVRDIRLFDLFEKRTDKEK